MNTVGIDAHKRLHVAVALDEQGRELCSWRGTNSERGWESFDAWLQGLGVERRVGIEGAWGYGRGLARYLVGRGETVFEVNARWTAAGRQSARKPDKTDELDARAIALHVHREAEGLVAVAPDDETSVLDLLATERDTAVCEATRLRNQIHALLLQLDPQYQRTLPAMKSRAGLAILLGYQTASELPLDRARAAAVRRLAQRLALALAQVDELTDQVRVIAAPRFTPLTRLIGVNLLTAGILAGILGPGHRFKSDAALAAYAGASPLEASSAGHVRHRLNRGGNRRLNAVLYRIALTQAHFSPAARAYLSRRVSEGKTKREAIRALKRFLVRAIWQLWQECYPITEDQSKLPVQAEA
jgi:transposase